MSKRLITMDGGHVTPEIDSFLYRALMPRIAPTGSVDDIPFCTDYLLYGGRITPTGVNVLIHKTVMTGCGRIIEIPDSETLQAPSGTSEKDTNYILVFRLQPSASSAAERVTTVFVPEDGTFYSDDISTGSGQYDVKFAEITVDETGWVVYAKCILPKMPVLTNDAAETMMENDGQICVPTAEGVRKFVWGQNYFSKNSLPDKMWLLSLLSAIVESEAFVTKEATTELDKLAMAYSVYYPLNGVENSELWALFNNNASGAFVSAFTYQGEENGQEYSKTVQIAIPCALSLTKFEFANVATRTKINNNWTEWNIAGELDYTAVRNQLLLTKLESDNTPLDSLGETYSTYFSLSDTKNAELYNAFNCQAIGAFVSARHVRDETGTVYLVQCAVPVVPPDASGDVPCIATRSRIHSGKWGEWNTSGAESDGEFPTAENYPVSNPYYSTDPKYQFLQKYIDVAYSHYTGLLSRTRLLEKVTQKTQIVWLGMFNADLGFSSESKFIKTGTNIKGYTKANLIPDNGPLKANQFHSVYEIQREYTADGCFAGHALVEVDNTPYPTMWKIDNDNIIKLYMPVDASDFNLTLYIDYDVPAEEAVNED